MTKGIPEQIIGKAIDGASSMEGPRWYRELPALATAVQSALLAAGYVIVPREPTEAMIDAAFDQMDWGPSGYFDAPQGSSDAAKCWAVMLDVALKDKP
jgi:hypothetical protein